VKKERLVLVLKTREVIGNTKYLWRNMLTEWTINNRFQNLFDDTNQKKDIQK
jgi:hypothetical protein